MWVVGTGLDVSDLCMLIILAVKFVMYYYDCASQLTTTYVYRVSVTPAEETHNKLYALDIW